MAKYDTRPLVFAACKACGVAHHEQLPCASMVAPHEAAGKVRRGKATKLERSKYHGVEWSSDDEKWRATVQIAISIAGRAGAEGDGRRQRGGGKSAARRRAAGGGASSSPTESAGGEDAIIATVWLGLYEKETVAAGVHDIATRMQYGRAGLAADDARSRDAIGVLNFTAKSMGGDAKRKRETDKTLWTCCDECGKWRATTRDVHNNVRRLNNAVKLTCSAIGRFCAEAQDIDVVATADSDSDDELDGVALARCTLRAVVAVATAPAAVSAAEPAAVPAAVPAGAVGGAVEGDAPDAAAQRAGAEGAAAATCSPAPLLLASSRDAAAPTHATLAGFAVDGAYSTCELRAKQNSSRETKDFTPRLHQEEAVRPRRPRHERWLRSGQRALDVQNLRIAGRLPRTPRNGARGAPRAACSAAPRHAIRAVLKCDVSELKRLDDQMCRTLSQYAKPPVVAYGLQWFMLHCATDRVKYRNWETLAAVPMGSASLRVTPPLSLAQHAARVGETAEGAVEMEVEAIGGVATATTATATATATASTPPPPLVLAAAAATDAVGFVVFCLCVNTNGSSDPEVQAKAAAGNPLLLKHAWLEIFWIMVDSSARRQGVGKRLINAAMARARVRWPQVEEVRLHVLTQNRSAVRFYAKELNFVILDRKPYYSCYSAYRMHRPINDASAAAFAQSKRDAAAACIVGRHVAREAYTAAVEAAVIANEAFESAKRVLNERKRKEREAKAAAERRRLVRSARLFLTF